MSLLIPTRAIVDTNANYPLGYHRGNVGGLPAVEADLIAANIKFGVTMFGILGTMITWIFEINPPVLSIPAPSLGLATATASSPPGLTATEPLTVPEPVIGDAAVKSDPLAVDGGVAHDDDGADTDETAETNSAVINDMHLLPSPGALGDGFYIGSLNPFDWLCLNIGTAGAGVWTIAWKYWDGLTWTALTLIGLKDQTAHFRTTGKKWVTFQRPGDWALNVISALNLYWVKGECTAYTSMTVQPLGTQSWIGKYT